MSALENIVAVVGVGLNCMFLAQQSSTDRLKELEDQLSNNDEAQALFGASWIRKSEPA